MELIVIPLVGSAVLLVVFGIAAWCGGGRAVALVSVPALLVAMCCMSLFGILQVLLTLVVALVCWGCEVNNRWLMTGSVGAMVAAFVGTIVPGIVESKRNEAQRARYPLVSLADRLAYETRRASEDSEKTDEDLELSSQVAMNLRSFEGERETNYRAYQLERLHNRTTDSFIMARGFGPVRMREIDLNDLDLSEPPLVPLPDPQEYSPELQPMAPLATVPPIEKTQLQQLHRVGMTDLLVPQRMGYVRDRTAVAGFQSHGFSRMPEVSETTAHSGGWRVVRLELVGVARHDTPVAYVADHLPNMRELAGAETRALDAFESAAVDKLRADQDVVVDQQDVRIRMVGALRAANDCLQCHEVRRGQLLGGLSYELVPVDMPAAPKPPKNAVSAG